MWIGWIEFDYLLGDVHSLKQKRSVTKPLLAEIRRKFAVSAAEVDHLDLHRRAAIGVTAVSPDLAHLTELLDAVERFGAGRPDIQLIAARRRQISSYDID
ncbi:MAG: DUF503 domain-containing protein [Gordonia sp.]|jgi:uncharacterized protein YlxP (DUF503 family)|uniref:DUF503 domain-containing protein n=1 Tax=Gordonia sp. (in: high G+C Gram-positive bacteria) TaxID=84139 RepID=UPI001DDCE024|nr:DUF503 domain-containing protein [Gordonia sp. (in: high G+C Gram-positive bacteria)]MCB1293164.1 DUF503 domain-containing protein [Gordonia sp. (in: high G+C Gram-positive bacteria)]HQV19531.1 DUF503 domain-containing protein [Gordonia sp. (in: high G+C Gram-positive bacteria)]